MIGEQDEAAAQRSAPASSSRQCRGEPAVRPARGDLAAAGHADGQLAQGSAARCGSPALASGRRAAGSVGRHRGEPHLAALDQARPDRRTRSSSLGGGSARIGRLAACAGRLAPTAGSRCLRAWRCRTGGWRRVRGNRSRPVLDQADRRIDDRHQRFAVGSARAVVAPRGARRRLDVLAPIMPLAAARDRDRAQPAAADIGVERVELDRRAGRRPRARSATSISD